jgi:hypothetical protein
MNDFNWIVETEFGQMNNDYDDVINSISNDSLSYLKKWLNILLFRDFEYFKTFLSNTEYKEFEQKINNYTDTYGSEFKNCPLYFIKYEFSSNLENTLLTLRNDFAKTLLKLIILPSEMFEKYSLGNFAIDLKKINNIIKKDLQEIAFDMGCSSYALGKIYKIISFYKNYNNENFMSSNMFDTINEQIQNEFLNIPNLIKLNEDDNILLEEINYCKKNFYPIKKNISNKIIAYMLFN